MLNKYRPTSEEEYRAESMMTEAQRESSYARKDKFKAMEKQREMDAVKRQFTALKHAPDDVYALISHQYKSREPSMDGRFTKALAMQFLKGYFDETNENEDEHVWEVKILTAEEFQIKIDKEAREHEEAESRTVREARMFEKREEEKGNSDERMRKNLGIEPKCDVDLVISPGLKSDKNLGILRAIEFFDTLKNSVEHPAFYVGEQNKIVARIVKLTHQGWQEHDDLKRAFKAAARVESRIQYLPAGRSGKKNYQVEVVFKDEKSGKLFEVMAVFNEDGLS